MSFTTPCFCRHLIPTTTSPYCGAAAPELTAPRSDSRAGKRMTAPARIGHRPIPFSHREAA
jgi:hypothetical protein